MNKKHSSNLGSHTDPYHISVAIEEIEITLTCTNQIITTVREIAMVYLTKGLYRFTPGGISAQTYVHASGRAENECSALQVRVVTPT